MAHLLEKQYKRGERARKKNKQEERKMVHEISGKNGLRALHEYRVEMVTREQRKIAEELERIREGLRMHKGQRWNAGARHKEAKRGLQLAAIVSPRREASIFSSAKTFAHQHRGRLDASLAGISGTVSGAHRTAKSGPFLTSRRPSRLTAGETTAAGSTLSPNPVSGRQEKKVPRLQLHGAVDSGREDALTSSRSMGHLAISAGPGVGDSSDDSDSDADYDDDSDGGGGGGGGGRRDRPPHPDLLKAILQGVVQCWEETVAAAADPMGSAGGRAERLAGGEIPSTATSIGDFLSPRGLDEKSGQNKDSDFPEKRRRQDNALSLALLKNMKANNIDGKKLVLEKRLSTGTSGADETVLHPKGTLFTKVPGGEPTASPSNVRRRRISAQGLTTPSLSRSASSRQGDVMETVAEYVADITRDLPQIHENTTNAASQSGDAIPSSRNIHSAASSTNRKGKAPHSAQSTRSSKVSESEKSTERGSQRSYGRHVRTTRNKDSKNQSNQSRPVSGKSGKSERSSHSTDTKVFYRNPTAEMDQNRDTRNVADDEDSVPRVSFRLPPLKKEKQPGSVSKSARSSLSLIQDSRRDSTMTDARNNDNNVTKYNNSSIGNGSSNNNTPLPRLQQAAEPKLLNKNRSRRDKLTTTLPRIPVSSSASSTPRLASQSSTLPEGADDLANNTAHDTKENQLNIDFQSARSNPGGGIRYKKKLHVYQKSPRSNN
ncbi:hypothetical protein EGW08_003799 [Elysia chlorotica]|uniref:Uncharacterized protein n=1 Tax=Elysia chlorotica TaxID=188477 RepID=A0A3S1ACP3_ELYCH|nr:hypothetical protein EGW08_003799 [Elysia chlorotica]